MLCRAAAYPLYFYLYLLTLLLHPPSFFHLGFDPAFIGPQRERAQKFASEKNHPLSDQERTLARDMSNRLLAGAAVVLLLAVALYVNDREELSIVQDAEAVFTEAEKTFAKTMETASASGMRAALEGYATAAGLLNGLGGFAGWLGQPLRLRVMHRMAAAQELLREDPVAIVAGHEALLREVRRTGVHLHDVYNQSDAYI